MPDERFITPEKDRTPWHQKSPYAGVKDDPNELIVEVGRVYRGVNKTLTREAVEETRAGYRCGICQEPQRDGAWPKTCSLCGRDFQKAYDAFEKGFQGEEWVGTTINWRKEIDRLDDELEQDNWAERPTSGIVIPRSIRSRQ